MTTNVVLNLSFSKFDSNDNRLINIDLARCTFFKGTLFTFYEEYITKLFHVRRLLMYGSWNS